MARKLILNADDFGLCHSANEAVMELFEGGWVRSSTIMTPCPGAEEAVAFAASHPEYAIGVHLTHTNEWEERCPWGPLTGAKSLQTPEGRMWRHSGLVAEHGTEEDICAESRAQIAFCRARGMNPSHADSHMGAAYGLYGQPNLLERTITLCGEEGLPFRMFSRVLQAQRPEGLPPDYFAAMCARAAELSREKGVPMPDYLVFPEKAETGTCYEEFRKNFTDYILAIPEGISETYVHPALPTEEMKAITDSWPRRSWEYRLLKDPAFHEALDKADIQLIDYRDLACLRQGSVS